MSTESLIRTNLGLAIVERCNQITEQIESLERTWGVISALYAAFSNNNDDIKESKYRAREQEFDDRIEILHAELIKQMECEDDYSSGCEVVYYNHDHNRFD